MPFPRGGPLQVGREFRVAHEVRDRDAEVHLAPQSQALGGHPVEPEDFAVFRQQHDAVRKRGAQPPELAELLRDAPLVELLAPVDPVDDRNHVAPDAADVRRIFVCAMLEPALHAEQVDELPGEHAAQDDQSARGPCGP